MCKTIPSGRHRSELGRCLCRDGRNIFELKRDGTDALRKLADSVQVLVRGGDFNVGHLARWECRFQERSVWTR